MYTFVSSIIVSETIIFQSSGRRGKNRGREGFPKERELSTKGSFDVIKKVSPAQRTEE